MRDGVCGGGKGVTYTSFEISLDLISEIAKGNVFPEHLRWGNIISQSLAKELLKYGRETSAESFRVIVGNGYITAVPILDRACGLSKRFSTVVEEVVF